MIPTKITDADLWAFMDTEPAPEPPRSAFRGLAFAAPLGLAFWTFLIWRLAS